jgi:hypothetical protein
MTPIVALQAALAAEHAAIYGYGVVGSVLRGPDRGRATIALAAHEAVRDQLIELISALGSTPVAARSAYQLPFAVDDQHAARQLGGHLEEGTGGTLWDLVAASAADSAPRSLAIDWLSDSALRAAFWGSSQALPGQPT